MSGGNPRKLRAGVDERMSHNSALTGAHWILQLEVDAEGAHCLGHANS
jgi:hypothetical protein